MAFKGNRRLFQFWLKPVFMESTSLLEVIRPPERPVELTLVLDADNVDQDTGH